MLTEYIDHTLRHATYEILDDGTYYGHIAGVEEISGLWANEASLEECRDELKSVVEDWLILALREHWQIPVIDGIDLTLTTVPV